MTALIILLAVSLLIAVGFLIAFIWSVRKGQYEDTHSPANRILFSETITNKKENN